MAISDSRLQQFFIAYYGRPANKEGISYWQAQQDLTDESALVWNFGNAVQPEFIKLYGAAVDPSDFINAVFNNLFARDAEPAGLNYWLNEYNKYIAQGIDADTVRGQMVIWILDGARNGFGGDDLTAVTNKTTAALAYTDALDTTEEQLAYENPDQQDAGRAFLSTVDSTNVPTDAEIDAAVAAMVANTVETFTLTSGTDVATAHIFEAPKGFTPGGTDQVNTLNDDDVLTGTAATDDVLNFNYVNDADTADYDIQPTLSGIETVNVEFSTGVGATLDLQDSTDILNVNLSRIDDGASVTIDNIAEASTNNLSINNSNATTSSANFTYLGNALQGTDDSVTLTLNNAQVRDVVVEQNAVIPSEGFETFNLVSTGANPNTLRSLQAEDVRTLNISGTQDVSIFGSAPVTDNISGAVLVEALATTGGLLNMAGSLTSIDASGLSGNLEINLNNVLTATADGTSGTDVAVSVLGGSGDDKFWLGTGIDANDSIDGGAGGNTAVLVGGTIDGEISSTQTLEVRSNADVTVDTSKLADLEDILVRNEGNTGAPNYNSTARPTTVTLNNVASSVAQNGITVLHGTTYNNAWNDLQLNVDLATDGSADSVVYTLEDGVNSDPRFNLNITSTDFESVTLEDNDTEDNTISLTGTKPSATLTVTGGEAGDFLNLDYSVGPEAAAISASSATDVGVYGYDLADANRDDDPDGAGPLLGDNGDDDIADDTQATSQQLYTTVDNYGRGADGINGNADDAASAAAVFTTTTIDASAQVSDLVIRVGSKEGQTITLGSGDDTVVFDASNDRAGDLSTEYAHAGLTNSDTVTGGAGTDTLVVDGESNTGISLQQSEWQNVAGIDQIYIASNNGSTLYANGTGINYNYRLDITDQLIDSTDGGSSLKIRNDINRSDTVNAHEAAATRSANLLLDLTNITTSANTVTYDGAEGALNVLDARVRVVFDDATINGLHTIDGGDTDVTDIGLGNANVIEVQNSATVTIADLNGLSNLDSLEFVSTLATDQTLNLDLNNAILDRLADSNHTASSLEREAFGVFTYNNAVGNAALVLNTTNVTGTYDLTINTVGDGSNLVNDTVRLNVSTETDYTVDLGANGLTAPLGDTVELFGTAPGFVLTDTTVVDPSFSLQYLDVLGNPTGVVSDFTNVEFLDLRNYTDAAGGSTGILVSGDLGATAIITNDGFSITGSAGADVINLGAGAQIVTGGAGVDTFIIGNGGSGITLATADTITDFLSLTDQLSLGVAATGGVNAFTDAGQLDFASSLAAANIEFAADTGGGTEYYVTFDLTNTYVFIDNGADGVAAEEVIVVTGSNAVAFADIIA